MAEAVMDDIDDISSDSDGEITRILENKDSTKRSTARNTILAFYTSLKDVKSAEKYLLYLLNSNDFTSAYGRIFEILSCIILIFGIIYHLCNPPLGGFHEISSFRGIFRRIPLVPDI